MSSSRKILSVIVSTGLFSMGTTVLLANGSERDRNLVTQVPSYSGSSELRQPSTVSPTPLLDVQSHSRR